jgi:hypothetical protein
MRIAVSAPCERRLAATIAWEKSGDGRGVHLILVAKKSGSVPSVPGFAKMCVVRVLG